jgi:Zn-dependent protease
MSWSFRIGRIAGTDIKVHITFLLLLGFFAVEGYREGGTAGALGTTLFTLALFGCVILHEFGHITMARRFGVRTPDVIVLPIGGVARLERLPEEPRQELLIALAGPAVTVAIAAVLYLLITATTGATPPLRPFQVEENAPFVNQLMDVNVGLLLFNLIPAFPMDGGRVLRAILASRLGLSRATRIAARIGQGLAVGFGIAGLYLSPILILIALFVFAGAGTEAAAVEARSLARGLTVDRVMVTAFRQLPVHARLQDAVDLLLTTDQREFPVVDNLGHLEGMLTRERLIRGLSQLGPQSTVAESMVTPVAALPAGMDFPTALDHLRTSGLPALPVQDASGRLVGLFTLDNISELLLVRRAVERLHQVPGGGSATP